MKNTIDSIAKTCSVMRRDSSKARAAQAALSIAAYRNTTREAALADARAMVAHDSLLTSYLEEGLAKAARLGAA